MPPALRHGPGDLRQPGERAPGAGVEVLRGTPRMFERLHHHPLSRRGIDEQTIDLSVQRETVALGKLLDCPITVRNVDRVMLALVPIELEETMTPIPDVLEPGYFRAPALPAVYHGPAKIAHVQVRRGLDQREHFGSLRGPEDCLLHPLPLSLCSLICVRHGAARCQVTRDTTRPATHRHRSLRRP